VFLDGSDDFGKVEAERGSQSFDDVGVEDALVFFGAEICVCSDKLAELRKIEIKEENLYKKIFTYLFKFRNFL